MLLVSYIFKERGAVALTCLTSITSFLSVSTTFWKISSKTSQTIVVHIEKAANLLGLAAFSRVCVVYSLTTHSNL